MDPEVAAIVGGLAVVVIGWSVTLGLLEHYKKIKPVNYDNLYGWFLVSSIGLGILILLSQYLHFLPFVPVSHPTY